MKAIKIDTKNKSVYEIEVFTLADLQEAVGGYIETALNFDNGDTLYVNEEGLLREPFGFFYYRGAIQPYAGNGIIVGINREDGDTIPAKSDPGSVVKDVMFVDRLFVSM